MSCHSLAVVQDLHASRGQPYIDFLAHQLVGDAVEVAIYLNMVVDIDARLLPLAVLERRGGQWLQCRSLEHFQQLPTTAVHLLEGAIIEGGELQCQFTIQLG